MGAHTVWLPAEHFMNINNWDDSLKSSASHYIKQVEEWIVSNGEGYELAPDESIQDMLRTMSTPANAITPTIITKPTLNEDVESNELAFYSFTVDGAKPFACSQCGKAFADRTQLKTHSRVHSGEKPFTCSECGKAFSQRSILTRHLRIHSGEKPFACGRCGKAFSRKSNMKAHLRVHSGEKPYACIQCGKAFADKNSLKRHLRLHSGEKPFSCEKCGKSFTHSNSRNNHVKQCKISDTVVWGEDIHEYLTLWQAFIFWVCWKGISWENVGHFRQFPMHFFDYIAPSFYRSREITKCNQQFETIHLVSFWTVLWYGNLNIQYYPEIIENFHFIGFLPFSLGSAVGGQARECDLLTQKKSRKLIKHNKFQRKKYLSIWWMSQRPGRLSAREQNVENIPFTRWLSTKLQRREHTLRDKGVTNANSKVLYISP